MNKTLRRFRLDEKKAASLRDWQKVPGGERLKAVMDLTLEGYAMKGVVTGDARLQRTLVRVKRPPG